MTMTTHERRRGSTGLRKLRTAAVGLGAALLLSSGMTTASAAPVTEPVNWRANSGITPSGVSWTGSGGLAGNHRVTAGVTRTLRFSEPVTATFDVIDLNGNINGSRECVRLPAPVTPVRIDRRNTWNPSNHQLCYNGPVPGNGDITTTSTFRTTQPIRQLSLVGVGAPGWQRTITNLRVTHNVNPAPPIPMVAPAVAAAGILATSAVAGVRRLRGTKQEAAQDAPTTGA